ncbi:hypothetical protein ME121_0102 [Methylobacterium sp. ME121]|nr:hypothetical protein ME121_0102 [Methylobacterium sp. ME121]
MPAGASRRRWLASGQGAFAYAEERVHGGKLGHLDRPGKGGATGRIGVIPGLRGGGELLGYVLLPRLGLAPLALAGELALPAPTG